MDRSAFDFNKEILFGELGALISAPLISYIVSRFTDVPKIISSFAVGGAIFGACAFWLLMRAYDEKSRKELSVKHMASDIEYFTPGAFILALLIYYPSLYLVSKHFLTEDYRVLISVILSQVIAFLLFLIAVNIYRYFIWKYFGKKL
jgi:hypothetical protein